ncbi:hypothetical protein [Thalassospira mesophila]|uniref:Uncharacterized protein n=1 Tax=Thalassospira mesophila TaxID=1293891 RepID=A0A1Y2L7C2_9PROT|nr:hypothetical protein [Thalassospira mesophila]OSQ40729.1 hypothetical protein TMES_03225 [Thalassospira mesophila]
MDRKDTDLPAMPMASKPAPPLPRQLPGRAPQLTHHQGAGGPISPPNANGAGNVAQNDVTLALDGIDGRIAQNLMHRASALVDREPDRAVAVLRRWLHETL